MYFLSNGNGTPNRIYESIARRLYISNFLHVFRNEMCTKLGDCLYCIQDDSDILTILQSRCYLPKYSKETLFKKLALVLNVAS